MFKIRNGLKAYLYKDIRLFLNQAGIFTLLLPLVLFLAMYFGFKDFSAADVVQPFPIAIVDQDRTIMSRTLINQIKRVELFSEVRVLPEDASPEEAISDGAVAAVTIPKDLFYELYTVSYCPAQVLVNSNDTVSANLFLSIFSSIMNIVSEDESAIRGAYHYLYGAENMEENIRAEMNEKASLQLLDDALGRQQIFDTPMASSEAALSHELRAILSGIFLMVVIGNMTTGLKTIPEERKMMILQRLEALGLSTWGFYLSKLITVLFMLSPLLIGAFFLLPFSVVAVLLPYLFLLILFGFIEISVLSEFYTDSRGIQISGNLFLLVSLILGGTMWPRSSLPVFLRQLSEISLSYQLFQVLSLIPKSTEDFTMLTILPMMQKLMLLCVLGFVLLILVRYLKSKTISCNGTYHEGKRILFDIPVLNMISTRMTYYFGGIKWVAGIIFLSLVLFLSVQKTVSNTSETVSITVNDLDRTKESEALIKRLSSSQSMDIKLINEDTAGSSLINKLSSLLGSDERTSEGHLTIPSGFGEAMRNAELPKVHYESETDVFSSQSTREIIAGQIIAEESFYKAGRLVEKRLGKKLDKEESERLSETIKDESGKIPPIFVLDEMNGALKSDPFMPDTVTFSFLLITLISFTLTSNTGNRDSRNVNRRLLVLPHGRKQSFLSDMLSVSPVLILIQLCSIFLCGRVSITDITVSIAYCVLITSIGFIISRKTQTEGRVDGIACFIAVILCLVGGCFLDITELPGKMHYLTWLSPVGLARGALKGEYIPAVLLILENVIMFFLVF